jgi:predicted nucleotidyltransferase component of viral defense system
MRLFEHPDVEQAILRATEHFQNRRLRAAIIEKDYYVTEALRLIATTAPDKIIFEGGTSLAKGWELIQRFSEDIDIFLAPLAFKPRLGKNTIDRELKNSAIPWVPIRRSHSSPTKARPSGWRPPARKALSNCEWSSNDRLRR